MKVLSAIGEVLGRIVSRKFIAFVVVIVSAWRGLHLCLESENPVAVTLFITFAGMISSAVAIYSVTNAREGVARSAASQSVVPPA
jgi:hypothetical protein